jgi:hypothetical protein
VRESEWGIAPDGGGVNGAERGSRKLWGRVRWEVQQVRVVFVGGGFISTRRMGGIWTQFFQPIFHLNIIIFYIMHKNKNRTYKNLKP